VVTFNIPVCLPPEKNEHLGLHGEYKKEPRANVLLIFQQCMKIFA